MCVPGGKTNHLCTCDGCSIPTGATCLILVGKALASHLLPCLQFFDLLEHDSESEKELFGDMLHPFSGSFHSAFHYRNDSVGSVGSSSVTS